MLCVSLSWCTKRGSERGRRPSRFGGGCGADGFLVARGVYAKGDVWRMSEAADLVWLGLPRLLPDTTSFYN